MEKIKTKKKGLTVESGKGQKPSGIRSLKERVTPEQMLKRISDLSEMAGEAVTVDIYGNDYFAYGSELACLRLAYYYRRYPDRVKVAYNSDFKTWYFAFYPVSQSE